MANRENFVDIATTAVLDLPEEQRRDLRLLGGMILPILGHEDTQISVNKKTVVAPPDFEYSVWRGPGDLRDGDFLALTQDQGRISEIKRGLQGSVGTDLSKVDVAGLHSFGEDFPPAFVNKLHWVGDRYEEDDDTFAKALFPLVARGISKATLERWTLQVGKDELPILPPATTIVDYTHRKPGGLNPKDREKWLRAVHNLDQIAPEIASQIRDDEDYRKQTEITRILESLQPKFWKASASRELGLSQMSMDEIMRSPAVLSQRGAHFNLKLLQAAGGIVNLVSGNKKLLSLYQRGVENNTDFGKTG